MPPEESISWWLGGKQRYLLTNQRGAVEREFQCSISIVAACSGCEHIHQWPASSIVAVVALTDVAT
jgi:hypothetical protein